MEGGGEVGGLEGGVEVCVAFFEGTLEGDVEGCSEGLCGEGWACGGGGDDGVEGLCGDVAEGALEGYGVFGGGA